MSTNKTPTGGGRGTNQYAIRGRAKDKQAKPPKAIDTLEHLRTSNATENRQVQLWQTLARPNERVKKTINRIWQFIYRDEPMSDVWTMAQRLEQFPTLNAEEERLLSNAIALCERVGGQLPASRHGVSMMEMSAEDWLVLAARATSPNRTRWYAVSQKTKRSGFRRFYLNTCSCYLCNEEIAHWWGSDLTNKAMQARRAHAEAHIKELGIRELVANSTP